jgi:hypothetical protein
MASITDAAAITSELSDLAGQLHSELTEGDVDFDRMVELADSISQRADGLASTFSAVNETLEQKLEGEGSSEES